MERYWKQTHDIFLGTNLSLSVKIPHVYWYNLTDSHALEHKAGYYNTSIRDSYSTMAWMLADYGFSMCYCFSFFDLLNDTHKSEYSSSKGFHRGMIAATRSSNLPIKSEVVDTCLDDEPVKQVVTMSQLSFNARMSLNMFDN